MLIHKWFKRSGALFLVICLMISVLPFTAASAEPVKKFTPDDAWNLLLDDGVLEKISMGSKKFEDKLHSVIFEGKTKIGAYSFKAADTLQCYGYAKTVMQALLKRQQPGQGQKTTDMSGLRGSAEVGYNLFVSLGIPQRGAMLIRTASNEKKTKDGVTYYDWAKQDGGEGHSMIMLYYNKDYIYTIEGNAEGGRNVLFKRKWDEFNHNQLTRKGIKDKKGNKIDDPRLIKYAVYVSDAAFKKIYDDTGTRVDPKSIKISGPESVEKGKTIRLTAAVEPKDASQEVSWSTGDKKIATVNEKGEVTGKKAGTVTITATSKAKSSIKASKIITVSDGKVLAEKIRIIYIDSYNNFFDLSGEMGDKTKQLGAKISPEKASQKVKWESEFPEIATVDQNGLVTGKKTGITKITAKATDGSGKSASEIFIVGNSQNPPDLLKYHNAEYYLGRDIDYTFAVDRTLLSENPYAVGEPIRISCDIKGGKPPFKVKISAYEGDGVDAYESPLSKLKIPEKKFTTKDRHFEWTYTLNVEGGPLSVRISITDAYGFEEDYAENGYLIHGPHEEDYALSY